MPKLCATTEFKVTSVNIEPYEVHPTMFEFKLMEGRPEKQVMEEFKSKLVALENPEGWEYMSIRCSDENYLYCIHVRRFAHGTKFPTNGEVLERFHDLDYERAVNDRHEKKVYDDFVSNNPFKVGEIVNLLDAPLTFKQYPQTCDKPQFTFRDGLLALVIYRGSHDYAQFVCTVAEIGLTGPDGQEIKSICKSCGVGLFEE